MRHSRRGTAQAKGALPVQVGRGYGEDDGAITGTSAQEDIALMLGWIRTGLMVLVTLFIVGLIIGNFIRAIEGLEQGVAGYSSMADWRFW